MANQNVRVPRMGTTCVNLRPSKAMRKAAHQRAVKLALAKIDHRDTRCGCIAANPPTHPHQQARKRENRSTDRNLVRQMQQTTGLLKTNHGSRITDHQPRSCQVDVFLLVVPALSLSCAGFDSSFDPQTHARLPRVELRDLRSTWATDT